MDALHYLMAANAALWIGLGLYMAFLAGRQKDLENRVRQLDDRHDG